MGWESSGVVGFDLGPLLQGQTRIPKVKSAYNRLLLILEVYSTKPTHMKSWARNFLLDLTLGPSFKVKQWFTGFGELSSVDTNLHRSPMRRSSYWWYRFGMVNQLMGWDLLVWSDLTLKSWAGNLLVWSDLTLDPSFKVKHSQT